VDTPVVSSMGAKRDVFRPDRSRCCPVCGGQLEGTAGTRREYHEACGEVARAITRLLKWLPRVHVQTEGAALLMRRKLLAVANAFPVGWQRPRDARGKFTKRREGGT
jgi:hypothetical protein